MQRSVIQTLWDCSRVGMIRRGSRLPVCEYSTAHLFRPAPSKAQPIMKNKLHHSNTSLLNAVKEIAIHQPINKNKKAPSLTSTGSAQAITKNGRARRDEEITSRWITFVDNEGQVHQRQRLDGILQEFDRSLYFLVEVDPMSRPPVCRLFEKKHLFDKQKASKKKPVGSVQVTKEIVFGWNVSPHDMGHKLGKATQFLDKGNKVKIDIVYKRGQNRVDRETQQQVIEQVKAQLDSYKLVKAPTLSGSNCTMMFEQKK